MSIHDWSRVDAGVFHGFHARWIARLAETLIPLLPPGYYAEAEQHASERIADVLTLRIAPPVIGDFHSTNIKTAVLESPRVAEHRRAGRNRKEKLRPKHVAIRHVSGHRVVALIEIVSPGNKDRGSHVEAFVDKAEAAIAGGVHVVAVDLFPPSRSAPSGLPARIWRRFYVRRSCSRRIGRCRSDRLWAACRRMRTLSSESSAMNCPRSLCFSPMKRI